jgi:hypothetical protein
MPMLLFVHLYYYQHFHSPLLPVIQSDGYKYLKHKKKTVKEIIVVPVIMMENGRLVSSLVVLDH